MLNDKLEAAMVSLATAPAQAVVAGIQVVPGNNSGDKLAPIVICAVEDGEGEEDPKLTGNFWLHAMIQVKHTGVPNENAITPTPPDPSIEMIALTEAVFNTFLVDNLPASLSAAVSNFTVFPCGVLVEPPSRFFDAEQAVWVNQLKMKVYCCNSSIPA